MLPNVFLASAMKSGSTHISNCIARLGFRPISTHVSFHGSNNEEHTVDPQIACVVLPLGGFVVHQHARAIGRNVHLLKQYGVKPIVVYRNVLDSLLSWVEAQNVAPRNSSFCPVHLPALSEVERQKWAAYNVAPWYFSFFASWREADIDTMFVSHEDFYADQANSLSQIISFVDPLLTYPQEKFSEVSAHRDGSFRVGISGRGRQLLSPEVVDIVESQAMDWGPELGPILKKELL